MSESAPSPLDKVEVWLNDEYSSSSTADTYLGAARKFDRAFGLESLRTETATRFVTEEMDDLTNATRKKNLMGLKAAEKALRAYGIIDEPVEWEVVPSPTPEASEPRAFPPDDVQTLINSAERHSLRSAAVVRLGYDLALRAGETAQLDREDIDLDAGEVTIDREKNGPTHTLPIDPDTQAALDTYLNSAGYTDYKDQRANGDVFPSSDKLNRDFRKVAKQAGFELEAGERFGLHVLRHSRCANLLRPDPYGAGWDLESVKQFAGHSDVQTTQKYLQYVEDRQGEVLSKMKRDLDRSEADE